MKTEENLNKLLYKLMILSLKVIPMLIAAIYLLNTMLSFVGIDLPILSLIGGLSILPIIFLYIASYALKFCEYHRMFLHYVVVTDILSYIDYYTNGEYFSNRTLFLIHVFVAGVFLFFILYLKINHKKKMKIVKSLVIKYLKDAIDKLESDTCELSEDQAIEIMSVLGHHTLSKDEACTHLNISRSKFDELVRYGYLPKGRKVRGFKELVFYKDELDIAAAKLKK